jgi:hypothetical protein
MEPVMTVANGERRRNETAEQRKVRLAAELRSNLAKRKAQARARAAMAPGDTGTAGDTRSDSEGDL